MNNTHFFLGLILIIGSCGQQDVLVENRWIIIGGTYKNEPINFHSTEGIAFVDDEGVEIKNITFYEDGTVLVPGINSPRIQATWTITNDEIHFEIDSSEYYLSNEVETDFSVLASSDSVSRDELIDRIQPNIHNGSLESIREAFKIYDQKYRFNISLDTLVLESANTRILAVRDRTIDGLMRAIKPGR